MIKSKKSGSFTGEQAHIMAKKSVSSVKHTGTFHGKSNKLGQGGRAAQLKARGVPGGVIGNLARAAQAAPGQKNFHKKAKKFAATSSKVPTASTTTKPAVRGTFMKKKGAKGLTEQKTVCKKKHSAPAISGMKKFMSEEATEKNSKATKKKSQSK